MGKILFKFAKTICPLVHYENRSQCTTYHLVSLDIPPVDYLQPYLKCSCLLQYLACKSMMLTMGPLKYGSVVVPLINSLMVFEHVKNIQHSLLLNLIHPGDSVN